MSLFDMPPDSDHLDQSRPVLIAASRFVVQTWLFRGGLMLLCVVTIALLNWLVRESAEPILEALPVAIGLVLGFAAMHLFDVSRRKYPN